MLELLKQSHRHQRGNHAFRPAVEAVGIQVVEQPCAVRCGCGHLRNALPQLCRGRGRRQSRRAVSGQQARDQRESRFAARAVLPAGAGDRQTVARRADQPGARLSVHAAQRYDGDILLTRFANQLCQIALLQIKNDRYVLTDTGENLINRVTAECLQDFAAWL